ncbi:GNAT domain-containing protein [Microdochium trichocladiopsis]|uniref:GNAT domain-containing protein n=1 Tax=Microdochium trichocladiopsis TaxID=1682393 RepID=A0A9P9BNU6_9PEZI|nr:GNAT domain-containing protein [Microdochium trichocladiopsis]KAH7027819.1 GNAT domain-containing protein [Microdochium trichocladiopsis]
MDNVKVRAQLPTVPYPLVSEGRSEIRTERLILRPFTQDVLEDMHSLRIQPEVMVFTRRGVPDKDLAETQERINPVLPPNDATTHNWVVYEAATGEMVGCGGFFMFSSLMGWPEVGYMFKKEHWGKGYATEFLQAWLTSWWELPRSEVELEVPISTVDDVPAGADGTRVVGADRVVAMIEAYNVPSQRVLEKCGFRKTVEFNEPDVRPGKEGAEVAVVGFVATRPTRSV